MGGTGDHGGGEPDLYAVLGLSRTAEEKEIRRAYRNLITKEHPDKGGNEAKFKLIQRAYDVLCNKEKRKQYDATGRPEQTADEELLNTFGGGKFRDTLRMQEEERQNLTDAISVRQQAEAASHSAGFEAWLRSRGGEGKVFTADDVIEQFGVSKASYEPAVLPNIKAYQAVVNELGKPVEAVEVVTEAIPKVLEWGEVLVSIRAAPINPGDVYNVQMGASPHVETEPLKPPFVGGNDCLGVVMKVGPGVKTLNENDWVFPLKAGMGTWRSLAVWKEKHLCKVAADLMPIEYAAMARELCVAYRLLEDYGNLKPGDSVLINAANSTVGTVLIQLCRMLRLRPVAVVRECAEYERTAAELKALGAAEVLPDSGSLKARLDENKFFAKPRLALDAVGGASAARLADALQEGCPLVVYGCMSGKAPQLPWSAWVFRDLCVRGFNLRRWMSANKKKLPEMLNTLAMLVNADKLRINYTEYELHTEFKEAMEHATDAGRNTKILLRMNDVGLTYDP